jgi:hypothetical protein
MWLRRWTAPTPHFCHREKEQRRYKGQSYPTVRSAAWFELLTVPEKEMPAKNVSSFGDFSSSGCDRKE